MVTLLEIPRHKDWKEGLRLWTLVHVNSRTVDPARSCEELKLRSLSRNGAFQVLNLSILLGIKYRNLYQSEFHMLSNPLRKREDQQGDEVFTKKSAG